MACRSMLLTAALPAIVVASFSDPPRPNLTEWKESQQDDADTKDAAAARENKMAAVNMATKLLTTLRTDVLETGEEEAATYNKFACFCKDTTTDKLEAIQKGEDDKEALEGSIGSLTSRRGELDIEIQDAIEDIEELDEDMKVATEERQKTMKLYEANSADLRAALVALKGALKTLKSSQSPSLVQMQSVSETLRTAAVLADALGVTSHAGSKALAVFLQQPKNEVQMEDYKFHSTDIIETLEGLQKDFVDEKNEVDKEEVSSVKTYDKLMQDKTHAKNMKQHELEKARKSKADHMEQIAAASQELTTVEATLMDDKDYTNKLSKMCHDKAKTWDQRSQVRSDELATLTQAIGIIQGAVKGNTSANTIRFAQQATSVRFAKAIAEDAGSMSAIEAAAEEADAAPSFVQQASQRRGMLRASVQRHAAPESDSADGRDTIIKLLKGDGDHLKSTLLTALASRIAADPFAKVKVLIQELVERLLQEAANEANQKGWCDKATSDAKQTRDYAADDVRTLNGEMARLEARSEKLGAELGELATEIQELHETRNKTVEEREEESAENNATVDEANQGLSALNMCIDLLDKFYKTANKGKVNLSLAQGPMDDAPDAGFEIGEAYTGAQAESGGILGMLDVMKSDFERTLRETEKAEDQAEEDHLEFMTQTGKSLAEKEEAETQKTEQKENSDEKLRQADSDFQEKARIMRGAIRELLELKPVCVDTGMSYAERVARREDEIASLKKALCVLGNYAEYGPDGASDGC